MGAMKAIATELQEHWTESKTVDGYWTRILPDGECVTLGTDRRGRAWYWIDDEYRGEYPTIMSALNAVGEIARGQLEYQIRTWVA